MRALRWSQTNNVARAGNMNTSAIKCHPMIDRSGGGLKRPDRRPMMAPANEPATPQNATGWNHCGSSGVSEARTSKRRTPLRYKTPAAVQASAAHDRLSAAAIQQLRLCSPIRAPNASGTLIIVRPPRHRYAEGVPYPFGSISTEPNPACLKTANSLSRTRTSAGISSGATCTRAPDGAM